MEHQLIIGLGNPDPVLEETYHNVGVLAVQWLTAHAQPNGGQPAFRSYKNLFAYVTIGDETFIRPLVYMNESGQAVKEALRVFKARAENIVIIHDDSDIPIGDFKRASRGRSAGHRGIQSIIDHLKTEDFARIRIGIRAKDELHRKKAGEFVLSPITVKDKKALEGVFGKISDLLLPTQS
jgi:PTH1 family peptidyl-tRNA hydrolase